MGRPKGSKNLSEKDRQTIASGRAMGMSLADLARQFKTDVGTISRSAKTPIRTKSRGRPSLTSPSINRVITRISKANPRKNAVEIHKELLQHFNVKISVDTVKRRLRTAGLFGRRPVKKPMISEKNWQRQLQWATDHQRWTVQEWNQMMIDVEEEKSAPAKDPRYPLQVPYCGECTLPFEFCSYSGNPERCRKWAESNVPDLLEGLTVAGEKKKESQGGEEGEKATTEGEDGKKHQKRGGKGTPKEKKKEKGFITVQRAPRGKNKSVTVIKGLGTFDIDLKVASKFFASRFACGSSVTAADEIVIQGDVKDDLFDIITGKWTAVTEDDIEDLGDQKR